jgi:flagellar motility protein MotE (MotC chaperone)
VNAWLPVVASGIALVIAAAVPLVGTLRSLHANKPVTDATADAQQAAANASSFTAQQGVINMLTAQLDRRDKHVADLEGRIATLEQKVDATTARVEERDEQNDLLAAQLRAAQENLKLCRQSGQQMSDWMTEHFAEMHPGGTPPKMQWFGLDVGKKSER